MAGLLAKHIVNILLIKGHHKIKVQLLVDYEFYKAN